MSEKRYFNTPSPEEIIQFVSELRAQVQNMPEQAQSFFHALIDQGLIDNLAEKTLSAPVGFRRGWKSAGPDDTVLIPTGFSHFGKLLSMLGSIHDLETRNKATYSLIDDICWRIEHAASRDATIALGEQGRRLATMSKDKETENELIGNLRDAEERWYRDFNFSSDTIVK